MNLNQGIIIVCLLGGMAWTDLGAAEITAMPLASLQGVMKEQEGEWICAHESNGPEGAQGIPMQRLSQKQAALVVLVLLMSGSLALLSGRNSSGIKQSGNE